MRIVIDKFGLSVVAGGVLTALICAAAPASADPGIPAPPPGPAAPIEVAAADVPPPPPPFDPLAFLHPAPAADPAVPPADPAAAAVAPVAAPAAADPAAVPAAGPLPTPPDGMQHLVSPDTLPPGTSMDPTVKGDENPNVSYLKDLWHAVQNQEISGKEALLMGIAQRGMNTPYPDQAPGPNVPTQATDLAAGPPPAPVDAAPPPPADAPPAPALPLAP